MAKQIDITDGEKLVYTPDTNDVNRTVILSKWICDKHYDKVIINNAYGDPILLDKISTANPIIINGAEVTDPETAREQIGANW